MMSELRLYSGPVTRHIDVKNSQSLFAKSHVFQHIQRPDDVFASAVKTLLHGISQGFHDKEYQRKCISEAYG